MSNADCYGAKTVELQWGDWFVGDATHRIATLLGSCISVTLWHPRRRIGAMSHFVLPTRGAAKDGGLDPRFGDEALMLQAEALARLGVDIAQCEAKLFGGANMFPQQFQGSDTVGRQNGEAARRLLGEFGVRIVSESLYGAGHRRIIFDVSSGAVWVRHVNTPAPAAPSDRVPA